MCYFKQANKLYFAINLCKFPQSSRVLSDQRERTHKSRIIRVSLVLACLVILSVNLSYGQSKDKLTQLTNQMEKVLQSRYLKRAKVGIRVISLSDGKQIFARNPEQPLIPASNMKILTAATALDRLGTDYRFRTGVYADGQIHKGQLKGNIYLKGYGDPFLVWEEMVKIARYVHGLGIRQIKGDLIADDSFFDSKRSGNGWKEKRPAYWYNAPLGALSVNFNTVEVNIAPGEAKGDPLVVWFNPKTSFLKLKNKGVTSKRSQKLQLSYQEPKGQPTLIVQGYLPVGSSVQTHYRSVGNPPLYAASVFRDLLKLWGVKIDGKVRLGIMPDTAKKLYMHKSKPLALILRGLNKYSNNFTAEQVLKTAAAEVKGTPGTAEKGLEIVKEFLQSQNIDSTKLTLVDGSGLARENRLTSKAITEILAVIYHNFMWQPEFMASLPLAGVDGTLEKRLEGDGTSRRVRAKTGRIKKVAALSGYLITKDEEIWAFSMLMNDFDTSIEQIQALQDKLCHLMINFSRN